MLAERLQLSRAWNPIRVERQRLMPVVAPGHAWFRIVATA
jgi:hypothetical protein